MSEPQVPSLSKKEAEILRILEGRDGCYGLEIVKASNGAIKRGAVYVMLNRMQEKGFVRVEDAEVIPDMGGIPRKIYHVTGLGRRLHDNHQAILDFLGGAKHA